MKLKNFYTCGEPSRLSCVGYFPNRLKLLHFITINFYDKKKKKNTILFFYRNSIRKSGSENGFLGKHLSKVTFFILKFIKMINIF